MLGAIFLVGAAVLGVLIVIAFHTEDPVTFLESDNPSARMSDFNQINAYQQALMQQTRRLDQANSTQFINSWGAGFGSRALATSSMVGFVSWQTGRPAPAEGTREWVINNWSGDHYEIREQRYDGEDRLHCEDGPALIVHRKTLETTPYYYWHGAMVREFIIMEPETITVWTIEREQNAELRRIMIERYLGKDENDGLDGYGRYIRDTKAEEIDRDKVGILWRKELQNDEALVMVEVLNSTPEPDGSIKRYFLRVPPDTRTATQAIAWTFGLKARDYQPLVET